MKRILCRYLGHRWIPGSSWVAGYYICARCGEPGTWVAS